MLDPFDYKEPSCALCGGKEFYAPDKNAPDGRIPIKRIIEKLDSLFNVNDLNEAGRLLEFWKNEAASLKDREGELEITSELIGYYRKTGEKDKGLEACSKALELIDSLRLNGTVSAATIILNAATTFKCFSLPEKALALYDEVYEIYERKLNKDDLLFGGFYNNKALALCDLKRYKEAEDCYLKAIEVVKKTENHIDLAVTFVNMAHLYEETGKKNKITDSLFSAYGVLSEDHLPRNGYYAYVCEKCAPSFLYFGYGRIEAELREKAKKIYEGN